MYNRASRTAAHGPRKKDINELRVSKAIAESAKPRAIAYVDGTLTCRIVLRLRSRQKQKGRQGYCVLIVFHFSARTP
jgi:hypothetical protein